MQRKKHKAIHWVILTLCISLLTPYLGELSLANTAITPTMCLSKIDLNINSKKLFKPSHKPFGSKRRKPKTKRVKVTAYTPHECGGSKVTASNTMVREGIIAVSKDLYAEGWTFGRIVIIDNRKYTIEDILPSRNQGLDIFFWSRTEAKEFGVQHKHVTLL